ncbi:MAG TPA: 50S ribosomal protein L24 [Tissierellales bacterium]|nr:50S ribosomal protein L24 [Tissierellales bacterium]
MQIKRGDTVVVISGKNKGKKGKVLKAFPSENRVIVEGINMITKHQKASGPMQEGGIFHKEGPLHASKVMIYCDKDEKGVRIGHKVLENGEKVRVCKNCGDILDK